MKKLLLSISISLFALYSSAQTKDVTITASPVVEYTWWDSNTTLSNTPLWGVRAGFGFGPVFELRGYYEKSVNVKASLKQLEWTPATGLADKMKESNLDIIRKGGEIKFNLVPGVFFSPYITTGVGVQTLKFQQENPINTLEMINHKEDMLYGVVGIGTKMNLSKRVVLSFEGKGTFFNANAGSTYLKPSVEIAANSSKLMKNWSALASLDFYFGGVDDHGPNAISSAYRRMFGDGFKGLKFVVEPGVAYFDYKSKSEFNDQYFVGGAAGFDFSSLVGVRGFYYRATDQPNNLSFNLNKDLSMYGGYFLARLNQPRGVSPFITLGAGYLDAKDGFMTKNGKMDGKSSAFGLGGLGLEVPLSKYLAVYATYNVMLTAEKGVETEKIQSPTQVKTNAMYNAGLRFNFGSSVNVDAAYKKSLNKALYSENEKNNEKINDLRKDYQSRIDKLNEELDQANRNNDIEAASKILEKKKETEKILGTIDEKSVVANRTESEAKLVRMSTQDFDNLVNRILSEVRKVGSVDEVAYRSQLTPLETRLLQELNARSLSDNKSSVSVDTSKKDQQVISALNEISNKLDRNFVQMGQNSKSESGTIIISDKGNAQPIVASAVKQAYVEPTSTVKEDPKRVLIAKMNRFSVFTGMGFGEAFTWDTGVRGYMQIGNTPLDFMPEIYVSVGKKAKLGLSGNVVYNFGDLIKSESFINPYLGIGLGLFPAKTMHFGPKLVAGTIFKVGKSNLFVDYTCNGVFKQNQFSCGVQFVF